MKTSVSHRITSLILGLFIFISSSGISLDIHYCGEELFDYALFGKVEACNKEASNSNPTDLTVKRSGCCSFDHFKIETANAYQLSDFDKTPIASLGNHPVAILNTTFIENSLSIVEDGLTHPPPETQTNQLYREIAVFLI